jgi:hypothetical protein
MMTCDTCRFFVPIEADEGSRVTNGWCYRYPPVYVGRPCAGDSEFTDVMDSLCWSNPIVGIKAFCGEWREIEEREGTAVATDSSYWWTRLQ